MLFRTIDPRLIVEIDVSTEAVMAVGLSNKPPKRWPLLHLSATDSGNGYMQRLQKKTVAWVTPDVVVHVMMNLMEDCQSTLDAMDRFRELFADTPAKAKVGLHNGVSVVHRQLMMN